MEKKTACLLFSMILIVCLGLITLTEADPSDSDPTEDMYWQIGRFIDVLKAIQRYYVEVVDVERLITGAINGMLNELDPHSLFIEPNRLEKVAEAFDGYFYGIGIEFVVLNKILTVLAPVVGTPAERLGIRPGDIITKIAGAYTYGISEEEVKQKLRGPRHSRVKITVKRSGIPEPFDVLIERDKIPIYSVMASFMLDSRTGYILLGRFSKTTSDEIDRSLRLLKLKGMKQLILDLRNNSGGYLDQAVALVDKFFDDGKKIVSIKGRISEANEEYHTTVKTDYIKVPLIILINNGTASASEIVAGAIQDWDRGLIAGETSFGKGLVQSQIELNDRSAIRLTIARYYTPSGRLIQRSFDSGLAEYYLKRNRKNGAFLPEHRLSREDSSYSTNRGRTVYGGGGIQPDVIIEGRGITAFTSKLLTQRVFFEFGSAYANWHPELGMDFEAFKKYFVVDETVLEEFYPFISKSRASIKTEAIKEDLPAIETLIKSEIARNLWETQRYYEIYMSGDLQVQKAMALFPKAAQIAGMHLAK